jgi:hypothetical protein
MLFHLLKTYIWDPDIETVSFHLFFYRTDAPRICALPKLDGCNVGVALIA